MKATRTIRSGFTPFTLIITVESAEEARGLYAIFNHVDNLALLPSDAGQSIKNAIGEEHYVARRDAVVAQGVTGREFYR